MRDDEWDLIEAGDLLDHLPPATTEEPNPRPRRFQVFKLDQGCVFAVRMLSRDEQGATALTVTETAVISRADSAWSLVRLKSKVMATGAFIVKRAATGEEEYQKCPSASDRSMRTPQTLEGRR